MTFHYFNPDHEIALAMNAGRYSVPLAARRMRERYDYLPALWARTADTVIVDDVKTAQERYAAVELAMRSQPTFITLSQLPEMIEGKRIIDIQPWGWDRAMWQTLRDAGVKEEYMPTVRQLNKIRDLSHRALAIKLLDELKNYEGVTGFSRLCDTYEEALLFIDRNKDVHIKSPWSCSGRGVKHICAETVTENELQWIANTIEKQHSVAAELTCRKVLDFAVLFVAQNNGRVKFHGLSVFQTTNSSYSGNILASDKEKKDMICKYISPALLHAVTMKIEQFMTEQIGGAYKGPLGVDMMVCESAKEGEYLLNPCVEINLRRTMGHVALALARRGQRGVFKLTN